MLVALRQNPQRRAVASAMSIPPPVGGLNARDELADMDPRDALVLDNVFPEPNYVALRGGYSEHATGMSGQIRSLMEWKGPASSKLFASTSSDIYDVTSAGAVGAAAVSSLSSGDWQHTMMATSAGNFLVIANGADSVRNFDGTTWTTPSITGVTSSTLIHVCLHKRRLWFVEDGTDSAWYLGTDAISGAATEFAVGAEFQLGGELVAIGTLTRDGGDGMDDLCVFLSSAGECAVYQGTDPASATTWAKIGTYYVGAPIGRRPLLRWGGDLIVITETGCIPLGIVMGRSDPTGPIPAISDKINNLFNGAARAYSANFGWQGIAYPKGNMVLFNVPISTGSEQVQYVMNTKTNAWCRFTGLNGGCWSLLQNDLYFGGNDGIVYKADSGRQDDGEGITGNIKTAFNYFKSKGQLKRFLMIRPIIASTGSPSILLDLNIDFEDAVPTSAPTPTAATGDLWDTALWDTALWSGDAEVSKDWQGVSGVGMCAAVRMNIVANGQSCVINSFDVLYEKGGIL